MRHTYVVSISGISGSGKTTLASELKRQLPHATALYFDDYEYDKQPEIIGQWLEEGEDPSGWDLTKLEKEIENILQKGTVEYLILDYPFGKKDYPIKKYIDFAVWLNTPLDLALARRLLRDFGDADGENMREELRIYLDVTRKYYIQPSEDAKFYDLCVDGTIPTKNLAMMLGALIKKNYSMGEGERRDCDG